MEIVMRKVKDLKPYENNHRKNDTAVKDVAASIRDFGFKVPMVIEADGTVVTGHTRLKAAKRLKMKEVPCIVADDLTEEQIKAFRLADNKVSEKAEWDFDKLDIEIGEIFEFDMGEYGFDLYDPVEEHEEMQEATQERVENIENLAKAEFPGVGKYDIPQLDPVYELPEIKEWISFNYVLSDPDPTGKAVHFFIDDYQFLRIWNNPERYVDKLRQYVCVATPDFSPYGDMPMALQIYNHYRKHWVGRYMQDSGVTVIPTIRASTHPGSKEWFLDGEPEGGIVIASNMWASNENCDEIGKDLDRIMMERLHPCKMFVYGKPNKRDAELGIPIEYIDFFTSKFRKDDV